MKSDPFFILGISHDASIETIRQAWRDKSRHSHPDAGGSHEESVKLNQALRDALVEVKNRQVLKSQNESQQQSFSPTRKLMRDTSSFTIDVLPVECWHPMEVVAGCSGSLLAEEPPYLIEFTLHDSGIPDSVEAWCRCDLVPEAGGTTVHITVGSYGLHVPPIEVVRDFLVSSLNEIDWTP